MATLRDKLVEYIHSKYDVDDKRAAQILEQLGNRQVNGLLGQRIHDQLDHPVTSKGSDETNWDRYSSQNEGWVDSAAGQLGIPQKAADSQQQQQNNASAQQSQVSSAAGQAQQQAQAGDTAGALSTLTNLTKGLVGGGSIPSQVLQLTQGRELSADQLATAIRYYNTVNPNDQLAENDSAGFYNRAAFGAPGAIEAVGRVMEGQDLGHAVFNVWNSATQGMDKATIDSAFIQAAVAQNPASRGGIGAAVASQTRLNGEVPWQLLLAGVRLTQQDQQKLGSTITIGRNEVKGADRTVSFMDSFAKDLQAGIRQYGDYGLALVALKDPGLASQIYEQGGVNSDQAQAVKQIFLEAGFDDKTMQAQGLPIDSTKFQALTDPTAATGQQAKVTLPDAEKLKSAARTMYEAWFSREPSDTELNAFVGDIDSKVVTRTQTAAGNVFKGQPAVQRNVNEDVDPQSQLQAQLRGTPEYAQLFQSKPIGTSEEDYANQFRQAGASLLGGQIPDPDAVRAGMMSGNPNTTVRYLAGKKSSEDNSTFQQRIARAAQTIAQET